MRCRQGDCVGLLMPSSSASLSCLRPFPERTSKRAQPSSHLEPPSEGGTFASVWRFEPPGFDDSVGDSARFERPSPLLPSMFVASITANPARGLVSGRRHRLPVLGYLLDTKNRLAKNVQAYGKQHPSRRGSPPSQAPVRARRAGRERHRHALAHGAAPPSAPRDRRRCRSRAQKISSSRALGVFLAHSNEPLSDLSDAGDLLVGLMESFLNSSGRATKAPSRSPSRVESARMRAATARRALAWASVVTFGAAFLLARVSHPAASHSSGLSAPASLVAQLQGSGLGGGSIAAPTGAASVATSSS